MSIFTLLNDARGKIAVKAAELVEAKRRRSLVADALREEFPGAEIYFNGGIAHGDANDPLTDFDLGVVIPNGAGQYGPGRAGPRELKERARTAVHRRLVGEFPNLRIEVEGRKRSVLLRFASPVTSRASDFTGDIICAISHPVRGLWIPYHEGWDRSHPQEHTRLVLEAIDRSDVIFAQTMRVVKCWNVRHGKGFCSWHLKALALPVIRRPLALVDALHDFFAEAAAAVRRGPTPDPAKVGPDLNPLLPRADALDRLDKALRCVVRAIEAEKEGRPLRAQAELAELLPDIVPKPDPVALDREDRLAAIARVKKDPRAAASTPGLLLPRTRGWSQG